MSASRKRRSASKVSAITQQQKRVREAEARADRLAEKRQQYEVSYVKHGFMPHKYELRNLETGSIDIDDMRKEYSRLRSAANKRLQRIGATEFAQTETYKKHKDGYKKLSEIKDVQELREALADVNKFLNAKRSTLTYLKLEKQALIARLEEENERLKLAKLKDPTNKTFTSPMTESEMYDYWEFLNFMNMVGNTVTIRLYDSTQVGYLYDSLRKRSISWKDILTDNQLTPDSDVESISDAYNYWFEHQTDLDNYEMRKKKLGIKGSHQGVDGFRKFFKQVDRKEGK